MTSTTLYKQNLYAELIIRIRQLNQLMELYDPEHYYDCPSQEEIDSMTAAEIKGLCAEARTLAKSFKGDIVTVGGDVLKH